VDARTAHAREVVRVVRSSLSGQVNVFETEVRLHVALKETARAGRTILDYDTNSRSAEAYRHLSREVLQVCGDASAPPLERVAKPVATLRTLPVLVAAPFHPEPLALRKPEDDAPVGVTAARADAPKFETFVAEGWQQWLGASS
jgi:hypothetical protein